MGVLDYIAKSASYIASAAPTVAKDTATTQAAASGNAAGAAAINPQAASYLGSVGGYVTKTVAGNSDLQGQIAGNVAADQQATLDAKALADATAAGQAAVAKAKADILNSQNETLVKQASAAASRTSNVLTGAQGVNRSAERTSSVVLGGSDTDGARKMGGSNSPGDALLGGIKTIAGSAPARRRSA